MHQRNSTKTTLIWIMLIAAIVTSFWMMRLSQSTISGTDVVGSVPAQGVTGLVASVSEDGIVFQGFTFVPATAKNNIVQTGSMKVMVDSSTTLELITSKDAATVAKEREAFIAKLTRLQVEGKMSTSTPLTPPQPFNTKKISLSDIKVGDTVTAHAATDISKEKKFTATRIGVFKSLPTAAPTPTR